MKPHTHRALACRPLHFHLNPTRRRFLRLPENAPPPRHAGLSVRDRAENGGNVAETRQDSVRRRRDVLVTPLIAIGACVLRSAAARADEKRPESAAAMTAMTVSPQPPPPPATKVEEVINSRIYDATVIGEPLAVGKGKGKVLEKLMSARVVYLGEAEQVPIRDDKELELEIVKSLRKRCLEAERPISLALEAINGETLKSLVSHWPPQRWQEYEPLLSYCRDNTVRLVACGTPLEVLRTVQAEGIRGLSKADRKVYAPPAGSGFISGFTSISRRSSLDINFPNQSAPFGPSSYLSAQARVVEDYTMSQSILQAVQNGGALGMLVVVTGASHVTYGSRGTGLPARISKKIQKKNQVVILLDPERQYIRREGEVPVADFLWYSAARPCSRNCFDRAEIARVMNAAGRRRDALPQDIQKGLDLGLVSPEVLQNFFDLEQYPLVSELTHRFQGFRERLLADPKFLHRLAIEEVISVTTTLIAQYERRKENFFEEIDYVITDTVRGIIVDFFTVWLPAPTISFLSSTDAMNVPNSMEALKGLLGSIPDNAFQKNLAGKDWNVSHRVASVLLGGFKLASVGFISSIGAVASSNILYALRNFLNPAIDNNQQNKRSPILKTAAVYSCFLGTSANLRYQVIAGIVEHRISDQFSDQTLFVNMLSFVVRTVNSYWGTQQWIDLARFTGLQTRKSYLLAYQTPDTPNSAALGCDTSDDVSIDETKNQCDKNPGC
ncbi:hypothetical protein RJ640_026300 [Escallonia rubra]|uniref:Haem-binding uptake Tiki superfamily ChaN domain-containing protein n=1 Tax=Escallonia rubra TaxID=112253 RepID=A0AA88UP41_9ASTE|nr:hypothetical protein RJ640_026300 [Escallonia rubra]